MDENRLEAIQKSDTIGGRGAHKAPRINTEMAKSNTAEACWFKDAYIKLGWTVFVHYLSNNRQCYH